MYNIKVWYGMVWYGKVRQCKERQCMYVCMYVCMHACMHVSMYLCLYLVMHHLSKEMCVGHFTRNEMCCALLLGGLFHGESFIDLTKSQLILWTLLYFWGHHEEIISIFSNVVVE